MLTRDWFNVIKIFSYFWSFSKIHVESKIWMRHWDYSVTFTHLKTERKSDKHRVTTWLVLIINYNQYNFGHNGKMNTLCTGVTNDHRNDLIILATALIDVFFKDTYIRGWDSGSRFKRSMVLALDPIPQFNERFNLVEGRTMWARDKHAGRPKATSHERIAR